MSESTTYVVLCSGADIATLGFLDTASPINIVTIGNGAATVFVPGVIFHQPKGLIPLQH